MKVGIMSMQRIINYGSFLQAYGLKQIIEKLGHQVEFVDYQIEKSLIIDEKKESIVKQLSIKFSKTLKMFSPEYREWRRKQIKLNQTYGEFVKVFREEYFPILGITDEKKYTLKVDTLVIGSDEVFNCTQAGDEVGYSKQLFGNERNANRLISYAASFGNTTFEKLQKYEIDSEIGEFLMNFDAISVRDNNSSKIVKMLTGRCANKNIDPVLLYDFPEVEKIKINVKDYIVVYAYADRITKYEADAIRKFAHAKGKKILSLGFYQPFCDDWILASPLEVLAYIKNADYIITDTFHGTVFAIKYQKKFGTLVRKSNKEKLGDLLTVFQLENHQINDLVKMSNIVETDVDEIKIKRILEEKQKEAMQYLKYEL